MDNLAVYGGHVGTPNKWVGGPKVGTAPVNCPPIPQRLDPTIPAFVQEMPHPSMDHVVIPAGRILAAKATTLTDIQDWTTLTLAQGVDPLDAPSFATGAYPLGYTEEKLFRSFPGFPAQHPAFCRDEVIEIPYTSVNESYNNILDSQARLITGEWLMPYYGSASVKAAPWSHRGKLVRWIERKLYASTVSSSGAVILGSAPYPAFKPRIINVWRSAGGMVTSGTTGLHYNETHRRWVAEFHHTDVVTVAYEYGASIKQRVGQLAQLKPIGTAGGLNSTSQEFRGWLKWVTDDFSDRPLMMAKRPTTSVTLEEVTLTNNVGTLAHAPIVPYATISVMVTGTLTAEDGTQTTLTGYEMDLADSVTFQDYTQGRYYDIDFLSGQIRFSSNVSVTVCKVSYYYETDWKDGLKYDGGVIGLTDGTESGNVGVPPHLEVPGLIGSMRVMII